MAQNISFEQAVELARSGDPEAQYALSSVLHQRQQFDESLRWLRASAARGFAPARMTLATLLIDGRHCARDRQQAIDLLQPLAARDAQANLLLAELHGFAALGGIFTAYSQLRCFCTKLVFSSSCRYTVGYSFSCRTWLECCPH